MKRQAGVYGVHGGYPASRVRLFRIVLIGYLVYGVLVAVATWIGAQLLGQRVNFFVLLALSPLVLYCVRGEILPILAPWVRGARGERAVARLLDPLVDEGYSVFHGVDIGRGDIDHVVVGPTGIFAIETKNWSRRVYLAKGARLMAGQRDVDDERRRAVRSAITLKKLLNEVGIEIYVPALLALPETRLPKGKIELRGIDVMEARDVVVHIRESKRSLVATEIAALSDVIVRRVNAGRGSRRRKLPAQT